MKAQSFINIYPTISSLKKVERIHQFMSQPFSVELLTGDKAVLKGFEETGFGIPTYFYNKEEKTFYTSRMVVQDWDADSRTIILTPTTLDNFISDHERAGIELHWHDNIVEQFFA